jgi:hypothetical protein
MSVQFSQKLASLIMGGMSVRQACGNFQRQIYSGTVPTNADTAINGTLLATLTNGGSAATYETLAAWTITIGGSVGGTVMINMGNAPMYATAITSVTSVANTANLVAAAINASTLKQFGGYSATSDGVSVVTVTAPVGTGNTLNARVVTSTVTSSITATVSAAGLPTTAGVNASNCCDYDQRPVQGTTTNNPVTGSVLTSSQTWSCTTPVASGTATWYRDVYSASDTGAGVTGFLRKQGTITTTGGGGDFTLPATSITPSTPISVTGDQMVLSSN